MQHADFLAGIGPLSLGSRLRRLSDRLMGGVTAIYRAQGLAFEPNWFPLFSLLKERGALTVGDCAQELGLSHSAVSQLSAKMAAQDLLQAEKDPKDERRRLISLSDRGRAALKDLSPVWRDIERALTELGLDAGSDLSAAVEQWERELNRDDLEQRVERRIAGRQLEDTVIEDLSAELAPHFKRLNVEWLTKYFYVEPIDEEVLSDPGAIVADGGAVLFACCGSAVAGVVALKRDEEGVEVTKMAVTPAHQGQGIGKLLLTAAIERARSMGLRRLHLYTHSKLVPAVTLYRKLGFRPCPSAAGSQYLRTDLKMELELTYPSG